MGIPGLIPFLKSIHIHTNLSEYSGKTLGVDSYAWLHRGAYACASELVTGTKTTKYVEYAMHRVRMMRYHNITPYLVFDGGALPAKCRTELDRKKKRDTYLTRANLLASQGRHLQARDCYAKCVDITPQIAYQLIKALRAENVQYVVAPYEADAQLAFLERKGLIDGIITEDSDLLVFGCRLVLFKLDSDGNCISISRDRFASVKDYSLAGWTDREFRVMAILAGCDYLPSIQGLGLKTAHRLLRKYKTVERVLQYLRLEGSLKVPHNYLLDFKLSELAFLHQRVYDPSLQRAVYLYDVSEGWNDIMDEYVGKYIEPTLAKMVAEGCMDPITYLPMDDIYPGYVPGALKSKDVNKKSINLNGTLHQYFMPMTKPRPRTPVHVGSVNGKRKLSGELGRVGTIIKQPEDLLLVHSRFFTPCKKRRIDTGIGQGIPEQPTLDQATGKYISPHSSPTSSVSTPCRKIDLFDVQPISSPLSASPQSSNHTIPPATLLLCDSPKSKSLDMDLSTMFTDVSSEIESWDDHQLHTSQIPSGNDGLSAIKRSETVALGWKQKYSIRSEPSPRASLKNNRTVLKRRHTSPVIHPRHSTHARATKTTAKQSKDHSIIPQSRLQEFRYQSCSYSQSKAQM